MQKSIFILILLLPFCGYSQPKNICQLELGTFRLDHEPNDEYLLDSYDFYINRQHVVRNQDVFVFTSNYPGLDTIYMSCSEMDDTLITRFKPGHTYAFTIGAGMAGFTVYEVKKPKAKYSPVTLEVKNVFEKDSLIGFYCDLYGSAVGRHILKEGKTVFKQPYKFTNEDALAWIAIGKLNYPLAERAIMGDAPKVTYPDILISTTENIVYQARVHVRFMHNEKVMAVYDARSKKLSLEVQ